MINIFLTLIWVLLNCTNVQRDLEQREKILQHAEHIPDEWDRLCVQFNTSNSKEAKESAKKSIISFLSSKDNKGNDVLSNKVLYNDTGSDRNGRVNNRAVLLNWPFVLFKTLSVNGDRDDILDWLIDYWKDNGQTKLFDPNEKIDSGYLVMYVVRECRYSTLDKFLKVMKPKLGVTSIHMTPIVLAINSGDINKVELLLSKGAKISDIDIAYAFWSGKLDIIDLLHKKGILNLSKKFNNMWFIAYGAMGNQEEVVEYALAQGSPYYSKGDVRSALAKKAAVTAITFGAQTALGLCVNGVALQLVGQVASIFLSMANEVLGEMLEVKYCMETMSYVNMYTSALLKKGTWPDHIYPDDPKGLEKLYAAISKVIDKNRKDKSFDNYIDKFKKLKKKIENGRNKKDMNQLRNLTIEYKKIIQQMNPLCVNYIQTLKTMKFSTRKRDKKFKERLETELLDITCTETLDEKGKKQIYTLTGVGTGSTLDNALLFAKEYEKTGFYLPTLNELEGIAKIKTLPDGEYLLHGTDLNDYISISVNNGEIQDPKIQGTEYDLLDDKDKERLINFLFIES